MNRDPLDRREFMAEAGKYAVMAGLLAPIAGAAATEVNGAKPVPMEPISLDLTGSEYQILKQTGGAVKISDPRDKKNPIIVVRISETRVAAFSSKCSHWGCELPLPVDGVIKCHCHGSVFNAEGKVTHGPAKKDLAAFKTTLNGTVITISPEGA